jgi:hypothetical protein
MGFFFVMLIWMIIALFADILFRGDLSGLAKAAWILGIILLPLIGIIAYMITRPTAAEEEVASVLRGRGISISPTDEISRAHELLKSGAIGQAEFDDIKRRALA